jgi:ribulose-5-phosphate 4-epimerase/fuculose-1-phosphate aldolase
VSSFDKRRAAVLPRLFLTRSSSSMISIASRRTLRLNNKQSRSSPIASLSYKAVMRCVCASKPRSIVTHCHLPRALSTASCNRTFVQRKRHKSYTPRCTSSTNSVVKMWPMGVVFVVEETSIRRVATMSSIAQSVPLILHRPISHSLFSDSCLVYLFVCIQSSSSSALRP